MALPRLTAVLNKISSLATVIRGQATTVKADFDYDVNVVKDYINDTLIPKIEDDFATTEDLQALVIGEFGTDFVTEAMMASEMKKDIAGGIMSYNNLLSLLDAINNKIDINIRDDLKIKMRQSGLNLDVNAWSDTLEDTSGINANLSSGYTFDNVNKSLKVTPVYAVMYDATALPSASSPAWSESCTGLTSQNVSGGILTAVINPGGTNYCRYQRENDNINPAKTKVIEFRGRVVSGASTPPGGIEISIRDGVKNCVIHITTTGVYYTNSSSAYTLIGSGTFTTTFTCKIEVDNVNGLKVFINGTQIGSTIAYSNLNALAGNLLYFGSFTDALAVTVEYDYFYYSLDKSTMGSGTATVLWNAVTSVSVLTKAIVEAAQTLGTGTATYYISRDGGTIFTPCAIDTVTSISSQPSGTGVVLRVAMTGNAELFAVAWGGE